jgi:hypothetical protein
MYQGLGLAFINTPWSPILFGEQMASISNKIPIFFYDLAIPWNNQIKYTMDDNP